MTNKELVILQGALEKLQTHFKHLISSPDTDLDKVAGTLDQVVDRLSDNYPYFDTDYAGQMLKPPHTIARLAYSLALYINPNNHALDGGRASSVMEKEAVAQIADMFGWREHLGHLTGGGTMANMEALWVGRKIHPTKCVVASEMAHYTHERISEVLGLKFEKVGCDLNGRMDMKALEGILNTTQVGTVVVTLGTTGSGSVDPLIEVLELQKIYKFRIHVDAAYGGYFKLAHNLSMYTQAQYETIHLADSLVIDPHKHGLQPYGCGCILFKDPQVGQYYKHDSPYTYFSSAELHLGEISLECSRAGAAAVALWATMQMFPLKKRGEFAQGISRCHEAAMKLNGLIREDDEFITVLEPELDIVVWAPNGESFSLISEASNKIFEMTAKQGLHLALIKYPVHLLPAHWDGIVKDQAYVTCLRSCLMKHNHLEKVEKIWKGIKSAYQH
ncbi:MAG TPA: aminotransferase class V-fold PLP-dependent enzyme [Fulvivirga sp.]|nr:aminotransferase class V-fold PLP-dependent enzyme [Fulvivirga sp.]